MEQLRSQKVSLWVFSEGLNTNENWNAAQIVIYPQENNIVEKNLILYKFTSGN